MNTSDKSTSQESTEIETCRLNTKEIWNHRNGDPFILIRTLQNTQRGGSKLIWWEMHDGNSKIVFNSKVFHRTEEACIREINETKKMIAGINAAIIEDNTIAKNS